MEQILPQDPFPLPKFCLQNLIFPAKKAANYLDLALCTCSLKSVFSTTPKHTHPPNCIVTLHPQARVLSQPGQRSYTWKDTEKSILLIFKKILLLYRHAFDGTELS